jgi:hypothetical protein
VTEAIGRRERDRDQNHTFSSVAPKKPVLAVFHRQPASNVSTNAASTTHPQAPPPMPRGE